MEVTKIPKIYTDFLLSRPLGCSFSSLSSSTFANRSLALIFNFSSSFEDNFSNSRSLTLVASCKLFGLLCCGLPYFSCVFFFFLAVLELLLSG